MTAPHGGAIRQPTPHGVHAAELDCVQANLAVMADHFHGIGTHLRLGAETSFRPRTADGEGGLPTIEPTLQEQLDRAVRLLGLTVREHRHAVTGAELMALAERSKGPLYVVADAYHLPWVPYHGRQHMAHSLLLSRADGAVLITDAYRNATAWGEAVPGQWRLSPEEFAGAVPDGAEMVLFGGGALPTPPDPAAEPADPAVLRRYTDGYAEHADRAQALGRLCLETWLLARSRRLAVRYRTALGLPMPAGTEDWLKSWEALCGQVYVAFRRIGRGHAEPPGTLERLTELLSQEAEFLPGGPPRTVTADGDSALREEIAGIAADLLKTDPRALLAGLAFHQAPDFSSFRVVEIVERLEAALGVEFDAADMVPEVLCHLEGLVAAAHRAGAGAGVAG
ncbi:acyl carrier protein [Streptomyces sp. NPDC001165]|uniref:acyl carrier protein n=1 Tax=Streptomyces sp. NPDC001165 TaxID=3364546 RepID=UPI00367A8CB3